MFGPRGVSPPRFAPSAEAVGMQGFSYDLKTGYDLSTAADRKRVEDALEKSPPELLVLSPPCTDEGGWFHLNSTRWDRMEYLRRVARSRSYIRWCCKLFEHKLQEVSERCSNIQPGPKHGPIPKFSRYVASFSLASCTCVGMA